MVAGPSRVLARRAGVVFQMKTLTLIMILCAVPVGAQETDPLALPQAARKAADVTSSVLAGVNIGAEFIHAWRADDRKHAIGCFALRNVIAVALAETVKAGVHRWRPDGSDQQSTPSEHTWLSVVNTGWRVKVSVPIAIGTGYGRAAAAKHYLSDVGLGAAGGALTRYFICGGEP